MPTAVRFLCLAFFLFCASPVRAEGSSALHLDPDESNLWKEVESFENQLNRSGLIETDEELTRYVNAVARRVAGQDERFAAMNIRVKVIRDAEFNAFALPTGAVYVHTGLMAQLDNEAQLAVILGHEVTHAYHRHSLAQMRSAVDKTAFMSVLGISAMALGGVTTSADVRQVTDIISRYGNMAVFAAIAGYSRDLERDADREGFEMMVRAGYDPREASRTFERMAEVIRDEKPAMIPYLYQSHPKIKARAETFRDLLAERSDLSRGETGADVFQEHIRQLAVENAVSTLKLNKLKRVRRIVTESLERYPSDARWWWIQGKLCAAENDPEGAVESWRKAVEIDETLAEPYKDLGLYHYKRKDKAPAREFLTKYLELNPGAQDAAYLRRYANE